MSDDTLPVSDGAEPGERFDTERLGPDDPGDGGPYDPVPSQSLPPIWRRIASFLVLIAGEDMQGLAARLRELNIAIDVYPDAPTNYVFRGEIYLETGMYELAAADFGIALELAASQVDETRWGVVAQVIQDRAGRGLARAQIMLGAAHRDSTGDSQSRAL